MATFDVTDLQHASMPLILAALVGLAAGLPLGAFLFPHLPSFRRDADNPGPQASRDDAFLDVLAHELKTPLTGVMGAADLLKQGILGPLNPEQRDFLDKILRQADAMHLLLEDLLTMRRAQLGKLSVFPRELCMNQLVDELLSDLEPLAAQASVRLERSIPRDLRAVWGDRARLRQVLMNLLSNALKFTPPGGRITVRALADGDDVHVEVHDTGIGIAPEAQPHLFEPFVQLEAGKQKGGLGLGLPICKALLEAHDSRLELRSTVGQGTTFSFRLPMFPDDPADQDDPALNPALRVPRPPSPRA